MKAFAVILFSLFAVGAVQGQAKPKEKPDAKDLVGSFYQASDLYETCKNIAFVGETLEDTGGMDMFRKGQCYGYILASLEALTQAQHYGDHHIEKLCIPPHIVGSQVVDGVVKILARSETLRDKQFPALAAVQAALSRLFSCSDTPH